VDSKPSDARSYYILIYGLKICEEELKIAEGISLRRLNDVLTVNDLAHAGAAGFAGWPVLGAFAGECKLELKINSESAERLQCLTAHRENYISQILNLRGFSTQICLASSTYSWNNIAGHSYRIENGSGDPQVKLSPFVGGLLNYPMNLILPGNSRACVSDDDAVWLAEYLETFCRLADESERFKYALDASIDWRYLKTARAAVARIWSGIESLFSIRMELGMRLSILSASILAPRGEERHKKYKAIKRLYSKRSKAVHGLKISEEELLRTTADSFELLRSLLLYILERGQMLTDEDVERAMFY